MRERMLAILCVLAMVVITIPAVLWWAQHPPIQVPLVEAPPHANGAIHVPDPRGPSDTAIAYTLTITGGIGGDTSGSSSGNGGMITLTGGPRHSEAEFARGGRAEPTPVTIFAGEGGCTPSGGGEGGNLTFGSHMRRSCDQIRVRHDLVDAPPSRIFFYCPHGHAAIEFSAGGGLFLGHLIEDGGRTFRRLVRWLSGVPDMKWDPGALIIYRAGVGGCGDPHLDGSIIFADDLRIDGEGRAYVHGTYTASREEAWRAFMAWLDANAPECPQ